MLSLQDDTSYLYEVGVAEFRLQPMHAFASSNIILSPTYYYKIKLGIAV